MGRQARGTVIDESSPGIYHVYSRTVRRAFLFGSDRVTNKDYAYRLELLRRFVRTLARLFAIDVLGYGFMQNHYHEILRNRPDLVRRMSDKQVAVRWCLLSELGMNASPVVETRSPKRKLKLQQRIIALANDPERLQHARQSLSCISVFEQRIKGTIARLANKDDQVSGHFWSGRFEANSIHTPEELLTAMVYVDLNPVRAGIAQTPEESQYTSAYERIHGLAARLRASAQIPDEPNAFPPQEVVDEANSDALRTLLDDWLSPIDERREYQEVLTDSLETMIDEQCDLWQLVAEIESRVGAPDRDPATVLPPGESTGDAIEDSIPLPAEEHSEAELPQIVQLPARASNRGCLPISILDYVIIVDWSGRCLRGNTSGHIPPELPSILQRLGIGDPHDLLSSVKQYALRLANRFAAPVNQWLEAASTVVDTASGPSNFANALM